MIRNNHQRHHHNDIIHIVWTKLPQKAMALDFQQLRQQIKQLSAFALTREKQLQKTRELAVELLSAYSSDLEGLKTKIQRITLQKNHLLRCARPVNEELSSRFATPPLPDFATILAADGSQISPDRHLEIQYGLVNVGAFQTLFGKSCTPTLYTQSQLLFGELISGLNEGALALQRDLSERRFLVELAQKAQPPVISFTDGPMELWVGRETTTTESAQNQSAVQEYQTVLSNLCQLEVVTAGYIDKPSSNLVVRLLEIGMASEQDMTNIVEYHPLHGVTDRDLFTFLLAPGERSAIFALQSNSTALYQGELALHFFYVNVGVKEKTSIARVEIPAWVADHPEMISNLHAVLIQQCRLLGSRHYPYALHRAHEVAMVSYQDKEQVTQMILNEFFQHQIKTDALSEKQALKILSGRTRINKF